MRTYIRTSLLALLLALAAGGARASVKGDVNGDQMVSVTDVTLLVNIILGGDYSFIPDTKDGEVTDDPAIGPAQAPASTLRVESEE